MASGGSETSRPDVGRTTARVICPTAGRITLSGIERGWRVLSYEKGRLSEMTPRRAYEPKVSYQNCENQLRTHKAAMTGIGECARRATDSWGTESLGEDSLAAARATATQKDGQSNE